MSADHTPKLPTLAIIGAGSPVIAAAKAPGERSVPADCFEPSDRVGGNWLFDNRHGVSAACRDPHVDTSRDRMQLSDLPMPRSLPDLPHRTQIAACFDTYRFDLRRERRRGAARAAAAEGMLPVPARAAPEEVAPA